MPALAGAFLYWTVRALWELWRRWAAPWVAEHLPLAARQRGLISRGTGPLGSLALRVKTFELPPLRFGLIVRVAGAVAGLYVGYLALQVTALALVVILPLGFWLGYRTAVQLWPDPAVLRVEDLPSLTITYRMLPLRTDLADHEAAERALSRLASDGRRPVCFWARSPREALLARSAIALADAIDVPDRWSAVRFAAPAAVDLGYWQDLIERLAIALYEGPGPTVCADPPPIALRAPREPGKLERIQTWIRALADHPQRLRNEELRAALALEGLWVSADDDHLSGPPHSMYPLAMADHLARHSRYRPPARLAAMHALVDACAGWWPTALGVVLLERPTYIHLDAEGRLHSEGGPALVYGDNWSVWALFGTAVPRAMVEAPGTLAYEDIVHIPIGGARESAILRYGERRYIEDVARASERIAREPIIRVARGALAAFGEERYVQEQGQVIDSDLDTVGQPRRLWRALRARDAAIVMIEVVNSTPEPDGSRQHYFLRVPPAMTRCRDAVAWTFGLDPAEYAPVFES